MMISVNRIRALLRQQYNHRRLKLRSFTIVSDDCWGGVVYQNLGLPYLSPFVNMHVKPDSFLRLIRDFDRLIEKPLRILDYSSNEATNAAREQRWFPLGILGDEVEIAFTHQ